QPLADAPGARPCKARPWQPGGRPCQPGSASASWPGPGPGTSVPRSWVTTAAAESKLARSKNATRPGWPGGTGSSDTGSRMRTAHHGGGAYSRGEGAAVVIVVVVPGAPGPAPLASAWRKCGS